MTKKRTANELHCGVCWSSHSKWLRCPEWADHSAFAEDECGFSGRWPLSFINVCFVVVGVRQPFSQVALKTTLFFFWLLWKSSTLFRSFAFREGCQQALPHDKRLCPDESSEMINMPLSESERQFFQVVSLSQFAQGNINRTPAPTMK